MVKFLGPKFLEFKFGNCYKTVNINSIEEVTYSEIGKEIEIRLKNGRNYRLENQTEMDYKELITPLTLVVWGGLSNEA